MRLVILESPFAGNAWRRWRNRRYARACLRDSCLRGEAPLASHLLYTQALDDANAEERHIGIECGLAWGDLADATIVYMDRGLSSGMRLGMERAYREGRDVEHRWLYGTSPVHSWFLRMSVRWLRGWQRLRRIFPTA